MTTNARKTCAAFFGLFYQLAVNCYALRGG